MRYILLSLENLTIQIKRQIFGLNLVKTIILYIFFLFRNYKIYNLTHTIDVKRALFIYSSALFVFL